MAVQLIGACIGAARQHPFLTCAILAAAVVALKVLFEPKKLIFPANLERVREKAGSGRFRWKTRRAYYFDCAELFKEAHDNVSPRPILTPECQPNLTA
jgi:hypothetical protein